MDANETISFARAKVEIERHQFACHPSEEPGKIKVYAEAVDRDGKDVSAWETIPCTTKAILEWLGY